MSNFLVVIVGPTAVGKTACSIKLAEHFDAEILSADSRQFYKDLTIGTAKPTQLELDKVRHHFIDILDISEEMSAGKFEEKSLVLLDELFKKKKVQIAVGGSGLYVDALCRGLDDIPRAPDEIRDLFNNKLYHEGLGSLLTELEKKDPEYFEIVDQNNPHRIIRALEVIKHTGEKYSSLRSKKVKKRPFKVIKIGLALPRDILYDRINHRMDEMIQKGLFEEAKLLYPYKNLNALNTVGYKEIFNFLDDIYDKEECIRLLKRNSRRYAKRQLTWFKRDENTQWFSPDDISSIINYIKKSLKE
ncbi:MAG: tRNA (adenosine(37)-N6)-dimethylallyltransferase MiaA [Bacteroidota bacterium]